MNNLFMSSKSQILRIEPYFPLSHGVPRVDDGRVLISQAASAVILADREAEGFAITGAEDALGKASGGCHIDIRLFGKPVTRPWRGMTGRCRTGARCGNRCCSARHDQLWRRE